VSTYLISAGHGGTDPGAVANGYREADVCLALRDLVAARLRELRHIARTDGGTGINWTLAQALPLINGTDLAVELHCNGFTSPSATGVEVIALPQQKTIAQRLAKAIAAETGQRLRGEAGWIDQNQSPRGRLGFVNAGGLIVEMVFISNASDMARFAGARERVALAIAAAMCGNRVGAA
jgi:N-acetylmuramoyl-L-alanine amidase